MEGRKIFIGCIFLTLVKLIASEDIQIEIEVGKVKGTLEEVDGRELAVFLGIPYSEKVGRFSYPKALEALSSDPYDATSQPAPCPAVPYSSEMSEDCLTLDIYAPQTNTSKAVMFVVPVSDWSLSWSSSDLNPRRLAVVGDVIVVVIQYRSGVLGSLSMGDSAPGNYGFFDKQLALLWVVSNIGEFGGNKKLITLVSQAEGGQSDNFALAATEKTARHIKRVISESSGISIPCNQLGTKPLYNSSITLARSVGCQNSTSEMLECLKKKSAQELVEKARENVHSWHDWPFTEDVILPNFGEILTEGKCDQYMVLTTEKDLLIGFNGNEGVATVDIPYLQKIAMEYKFIYEEGVSHSVFEQKMVPFVHNIRGCTNPDKNFLLGLSKNLKIAYAGHDDATRRDKMVEMFSDAISVTPMLTRALLRTDWKNAKTFVYQYDYVSSPTDENLKQPIWHHGPARVGQSIYLDTAVANASNPYDDAVALELMRYWSNFAKTGNPNTPVEKANSITWTGFTKKGQHYLKITGTSNSGATFSVKQRPRREYVELWLKNYGFDTDAMMINPTTPTPVSPETESTCSGREYLEGKLGFAILANEASTVIIGLIIAIGVIFSADVIVIVHTVRLKGVLKKMEHQDQEGLVNSMETEPVAGSSGTGTVNESESNFSAY